MKVVVGNICVMMGWAFPRLCKLRGHTYGYSIVWIYKMKNLDMREVKVARKEVVPHFPCLQLGKWTHCSIVSLLLSFGY